MRTEFWTCGTGRIELQIPLRDALAIHKPGPANAAVLALSQRPTMRDQLSKIKPNVLRAELREYGAWDDAELKDHAQNQQRLLWIAACDVAEEHSK
jgi:hypothetical protein